MKRLKKSGRTYKPHEFAEIAAQSVKKRSEQPRLIPNEPPPKPPPKPRPDVHALRYGMSDQELPPIRPPEKHHLMEHALYRVDLRERSQRQSEAARGMISRGAFRLYQHLHYAGTVAMHRRNYHPSTLQVTLFCPQDTVMQQCDIKSRATMAKYKRELEAASLLRSKYQQTTVNGDRYRTGMLWGIKMTPARAGKLRLYGDDFERQYRDMESDLETGRTAWNLKNEHTQRRTKEGPLEIDLILYWSLSDFRVLSPLPVYVHSAPQPQIETVLDVPFMPFQDRRAAVRLAVESIQTAFNDHNEVSAKFLYKLMWGALRRSDEGRDYFQAIYNVLRRVHIDLLEGFTESPGSLFVYRVKQLELFEDVWSAKGAVAPSKH